MMASQFEGLAGSVAAGHPWVLVLSGPTRTGTLYAEAVVVEALGASFQVVWMDGHLDENSPPLEPPRETNAGPLTKITYGKAEQTTWASRLADRDPAPGPTMRLRRAIRRSGRLLRPVFGWRVVRPTLRELRIACAPPDLIIYCDEPSLTTAWHAARTWPDTPVTTWLTDL